MLIPLLTFAGAVLAGAALAAVPMLACLWLYRLAHNTIAYRGEHRRTRTPLGVALTDCWHKLAAAHHLLTGGAPW